jgi:preprotein translocase subunit YajC
MTVTLGWASPLVGAAAKQTNSSSIYLIFIVIGAGFYFLIYRPQQRKAKALREIGSTFEVGDEVLTAGGIVGYVIEIDGDRVTLETSVGASFVVLKQYVLRKLEDPSASGIDSDANDDHDVALGELDDDTHGEHDDEDHAATSDEDGADSDDAAADASGDGAGSGSDHPAGRGGAPGDVTKADGGDEATGSDGPSII